MDEKDYCKFATVVRDEDCNIEMIKWGNTVIRTGRSDPVS